MIAKIIVKCIIYNRSLNRFLLVRRCDADDIGAGTWENAGGNIEAGETPEETCRKLLPDPIIRDFEEYKVFEILSE